MNWLVERFEKYGDRVAIIEGESVYKYSDLVHLYKEGKQYLNPIPFYMDILYCYSSFSILMTILHGLDTCIILFTDEDSKSWDIWFRNRYNFTQSKLVLSTSGTSGMAKYVLHDLNTFMEKYKKERTPYKTILNMRWNSMGGIDILLTTLSSGGTLIIPESNNVTNILGLIQLHKVEVLPASPSFLNFMMFTDLSLYDLSSLKVIAYGSEIMPEYLLDILVEQFPNVRLKQNFGMTELGTIRNTAGTTTWIKLAEEGVETKVIDNILYIKSPTSMLGYLNYPSPFTEDGFLNTGDVVETDGEYIKFVGRDSNIINVGGNKVSPEEVEDTIMQSYLVTDVLVYGKPNGILGNIVVADIVPFIITTEEYTEKMLKTLKAHCTKLLDKYKVPIVWNIVEEIQYTENGKKRRDK